MSADVEAQFVTLRLDDFLWFASFEWAGDSDTALFLHSFALSIALGGRERVLGGTVPQYEEDLNGLSVYCTPARLDQRFGRARSSVARQSQLNTSFTFNSIDDPTQLTQALRLGDKVNDPKLGRRQVLMPGLRFEFVAFTRDKFPVVIERVERISGHRFLGDATPDHAVNPLDVGGRVVRYVPIAIPPHLIYDRAEIEQDEFIRAGNRVIHVPVRVRLWQSS
jgi:hypothetical protein